MAKSVNLTVKVDDTQFKQFIANFNAFSAQIKGISSQFTLIQTQIQKATNQTTILTTVMNGLLVPVKAVGSVIGRITNHFFRWSVLIGGITALLGMGGGLFGIDRLAASIMQKRRQILGLGGDYGRTQAAQIFGRPFLDQPGGILQGIRQGLGGSPEQQRALLALQVPYGTKQTPEQLLPYILTKLRDEMKRAPPEAALAVGKAYGAESLGFSDMDLLRIRNMTNKQLKDFEARIKAGEEENNLSKRAQEAWTALETQFKNAKSQIESIFGEKLADLAGPIGTLSEKLVELVRVLMNTGLVNTVIETLTRWLNELSEYLKKETTKKDLEKFIKSVESWLPTLKQLRENMERFNTVLGYVVDVLRIIKNALAWLHWIEERTRIFGGDPNARMPGTSPGASGSWDGRTPSTTPPPGGGGNTPATPPNTEPPPTTTLPPPPANPPPSVDPGTGTPAPAGGGASGTWNTPGQQGSVGGGNQFASWASAVGGQQFALNAGDSQLSAFRAGDSSMSGWAGGDRSAMFANLMGGSSSQFNLFGGGNQDARSSMFAGGNRMVAFRGGDKIRGGDRIAMWSGAAQQAVPGNDVRGIAVRNSFASIQGGNGPTGTPGAGPLSVDNWQSSRVSTLTIRNVPGANLYTSAASMSG